MAFQSASGVSRSRETQKYVILFLIWSLKGSFAGNLSFLYWRKGVKESGAWVREEVASLSSLPSAPAAKPHPGSWGPGAGTPLIVRPAALNSEGLDNQLEQPGSVSQKSSPCAWVTQDWKQGWNHSSSSLFLEHLFASAPYKARATRFLPFWKLVPPCPSNQLFVCRI